MSGPLTEEKTLVLPTPRDRQVHSGQLQVPPLYIATDVTYSQTPLRLTPSGQYCVSIIGKHLLFGTFVALLQAQHGHNSKLSLASFPGEAENEAKLSFVACW